VNAGPVNAGTRRACLLLAGIGALVLMTGVLLAVSSTVLAQGPGRPSVVIVLAAGLIAGGLLCGVVMIAVTVPGSERAGGPLRRPASGPSPRRPDPSEEWMDALRPAGSRAAQSPSAQSQAGRSRPAGRRRRVPAPAPMPVRRPGGSDRAG
jgi:hypothetical protein